MDTLPKSVRSRIMRSVRRWDTAPELAVRRVVHKGGFRYGLNVQSLPGSPDIVFRRYGVAVFVHGCFWHAHGCRKSCRPASNRAFWVRKFKGNRRRDERVKKQLRTLGYRVVTIWECRIEYGASRLLRLLRGIRTRVARRRAAR